MIYRKSFEKRLFRKINFERKIHKIILLKGSAHDDDISKIRKIEAKYKLSLGTEGRFYTLGKMQYVVKFSYKWI